ncbi:hypothetical protein WB44_02260 [Synechococcus sp. WH 8020]|nr:hypothetical protein WB44_02260 [Synechococcus sp. WH 8020]
MHGWKSGWSERLGENDAYFFGDHGSDRVVETPSQSIGASFGLSGALESLFGCNDGPRHWLSPFVSGQRWFLSRGE